jgi:transglutaminase-like putative cysteine protease
VSVLDQTHTRLSAPRRRAAPAPRGPRTRPTAVVDLVAVTVLLAVGVQAFGPVFGGAVGYVAAGGGVVLGLALAVVSALRRWTVLGTLVVGAVVYLVLGGPLALRESTIGGVVPTLDTLHRLVLLSWQSWRDLLTVSLPAGQFDGPAVLPYLTGLVAASFAASFALRLTRPQWALLPAFAFLVVGILWGSHEAPLAAPQGVVFAATALLWCGWRASRVDEPDAMAVFLATQTGTGTSTRSGGRWQRWAVGVAVLAVAGTGAGALSLALGGDQRHVLRDDVVPPLDLRAYASPLTLFRDLESRDDETLFTVRGMPAGSRIRLAALDVYDGNVYNVSETSARFARAGSTILQTEFSDPDRPVSHATVTIAGYHGVWLPGGGDLRGVRFTDGDADTEAAGLFVNPATGTALTTAGVAEGSSYDVDVAVPPPLEADQRNDLPGDAKPGSIALPPNEVQVESVPGVAADLAGDAASPLDQLRAVEAGFQEGYFADGTPDASLPGHTIGRLDQLLDGSTGQMVGDDEQYAVAMALVARELGLPARVVMGFHPDGGMPADSGQAVAITGADAHVWTEVLFDGVGWVPFDPTPSDDRTPDQMQPQPQERNDPQVLPPPEVPEKRDLKTPPKADSDQTERKKKAPEDGFPAFVRYAAYGAGGLGILSLPFLTVLALKGRRRTRRRTRGRVADRISGGWADLTDTAVDLGTPVPAEATRLEAAAALREAHPQLHADHTFDGLAMRVDAHVFGLAEPVPGDVEQVWQAVDGARRELLGSVSWWRRTRARVSLRSLLRPSDRHAPARPEPRAEAPAATPETVGR